jgi:hypothetical protein
LVYRFISYVILRLRYCPSISSFKGSLVWWFCWISVFLSPSPSPSHEC